MADTGPSTLSLFSGVGGLDLAWELATGAYIVAQCEADTFRRSLLARRWPSVPRHPDVRTLRPKHGQYDAIIGGFPCQPFSTAARGRNRPELDLWPDMFSTVRRGAPRWVFAENVSETAICRAANDLASQGYACAIGWNSSRDVGAPHDRRRWWLVADADPQGEPLVAEHGEVAGVCAAASAWTRDEATRLLGMDDGLTRRLDGSRRAALGDAVMPLQAAVAARLLLRRLNE